MNYTWLAAAAVIAVLDWIAVERKIKPLEYFAKPGAMLALIIWLWQASAFQGNLLWFGLGLLFSLAGDIFLLLPREQFIPGLVAFLLAHVAYVIGFNSEALPAFNLPAAVLAVAVLVAAVPIYRGIASGLQASGQPRLKMPVLVYTLVISLMLLSALLTFVRPEWQPAPALMVSLGALSFFISDSVLAWNKFVVPLSHARLVTMFTYHVGQALIVLGCTAHFLA